MISHDFASSEEFCIGIRNERNRRNFGISIEMKLLGAVLPVFLLVAAVTGDHVSGIPLQLWYGRYSRKSDIYTYSNPRSGDYSILSGVQLYVRSYPRRGA